MTKKIPSYIRLREALNRSGMKQIELSKKTGIIKSTLSLYLSGKFEPKEEKLSRLARTLNVDEAWLLGFDVPMERLPNYLRRGYIDTDEVVDIEKKIEIEGLVDITDKIVIKKLKTYKFFSSGVGCVDLNDYKEEYFMLETELMENISMNGYIFVVYDKYMEPVFFESDNMIFIKKKLNTWEELDSKLLFLNLDGKTYLKKLFFKEGIPYLHNFNERVFPPERMDKFKKVELMGVLNLRLVKQDMEKYEF